MNNLEKAIDKIEKLVIDTEKHQHLYYSAALKNIGLILKEIYKGESENIDTSSVQDRWVSVEERLPEIYIPFSFEEDNYLIWIIHPTGGRIEKAQWFDPNDGETLPYFQPLETHFGYTTKITHWQPLPSPPKE